MRVTAWNNGTHLASGAGGGQICWSDRGFRIPLGALRRG